MKKSSGGDARPPVLVVGPGSGQVGGLATFTEFLLASPYLASRYELIHVDTTRGQRGAGKADTLSPVNFVYLARQAIQLVRIALLSRARLVHLPVTSYWSFWKDATFIFLGRMLGLKVVAHLHGGRFDHYYRSRSAPVRRLIGWIMSRPEVVIALSQHWRRFLAEEVGSSARIEVVPNTVDATLAQLNETVTYGAERDANLILFVGALGHRKGVFDILQVVPRVLERHPKVRFAFVGAEEERGALATLNQMSVDDGLGHAVCFMGQVTGQAKIDLYLKAAIFLLPSYGENMPYTLLEAMGAGLPVVTTPVGAIPEMVDDGVNGFLIQPGDHDALADRIIQLMDDPQLRTAMSRCNLQSIRTHYFPDVALSRIDRIYSQLLAERSPHVA
jgi:glycosyltransferase involved in cell wall biosynthesis